MALPPEPAPIADSALALLLAKPFRITRPARQTLPFIFASPHSGRLYPHGLIAASALSPIMLRHSEDAFVDELFSSVTALGAQMISARFPRAYCDVNRAQSELDAGLFAGPLNMVVDAPSPRVQAGLGVIPRIVRDGAEIYRRKLAPAEAEFRLAHFWRPYHAALDLLVEETLARFGVAVLVDCHSMPSALSVPDIVLGDRHGASAAPLVTQWTEAAFSGFSTARNAPYAGGYTTVRHGRPDRRCHALQVEVNRALYLEEDTIQRKPAFETMRARLGQALAQLVRLEAGALIGRATLSQAAE